ncbi:uncharacterized protein LOC143053473 [Mytilus galloprovincialis]|uniref:uncharacterized protein LOC143053473 n=1 Tax=Mytilus galloprovincialis TaxID=29158 RepID=UPI003F7BA2A8
MEDTQCESCKTLGKNSISAHWCVTCKSALCPECTENHHTLPLTQEHELVDINDKPYHPTIPYQGCSKHNKSPFEYFCIDHDTLYCKECKVETHCFCQKVMPVDIASKGIKQSESFVETIELINHVLTTTSIISNDRHTLIERIEEQAIGVKIEIMRLREELTIRNIESLGKSLLEDLKLQKDKIVTNAKEMLSEIQNIEMITKEQKDTFDKVEKHGSEKQAFIAVHSCKSLLDFFEKKLITMTEQTTQPTIKLNQNMIQETITSIGTLEIKEEPSVITCVHTKKQQPQIPLGKHHGLPSFIHKQDIDIGNMRHVIKGIIINEKDELITTVYSFLSDSRIMIHDNMVNFKYQLNIEFRPGQIALIPDKNMGVVTSYLQDFIQFIDFDQKKLLNKVYLKTSGLGGIAASKLNVFVGTKGNISLLDHKGSYIRSIEISNEELTPWYIVFDRNIYYSDNEIVCCLTVDGESLFTYEPQDNKRLHGVAIDTEGFVYVFAHNKGVCRLRPDGTYTDIVVDKQITRTQDIGFNKDCTKLFIACGKSILVYNRFN